MAEPQSSHFAAFVGSRLRVLRDISEWWWVRVLLGVWALSGIWDLALAEWIPEDTARKLPRVYQVIAMTTGLLSWQLWLLLGALIVIVALVEHSYRLRRATRLVGRPEPWPATEDTLKESDPALLPPRDVKLVDALWRAYAGEWSVRPEKRIEIEAGPSHMSPEASRFAIACIDMRQHAFDGKLPIWAKRKKSWLYEPLPRDYWRNKEILFSFMMDPRQTEFLLRITHPLKIGEYLGTTPTEWEDFMTNRAAVEKLWPKKGQ